MRSCWQVLGLKATATADDVRRAYKQKAFRCHPDRSKRKDAAARFVKLTEARDACLQQLERPTPEADGQARPTPPPPVPRQPTQAEIDAEFWQRYHEMRREQEEREQELRRRFVDPTPPGHRTTDFKGD